MHPFMLVNLAGAKAAKLGHAPAWEHWSAFTQGLKTVFCHLSITHLQIRFKFLKGFSCVVSNENKIM